MRLLRLTVPLWVVCALSVLSACSGPEVIGGGRDSVSIAAGPLTDVDGIAKRYCQRYGKRAAFLGDGPVGPSTVKRLYGYDCVSPADPHG
jgi:hypothetical protein